MSDRNRIGKLWKGKSQNIKNICRFFLPCEFKPNSILFSVLDPFAYDIEPAYIRGKLGIISYNSPSYSIITTNHDDDPLMGFCVTITNPETILLLDKIKGYNGINSFNFHTRSLVHAFTNEKKVVTAWAYVLSQHVLECYAQIEQCEWGHWSDDPILTDFLDKIVGKQRREEDF